MTIEGGNPNISSIQSLRGIAALMVVLFHLTVQTDRLGFAPVDVATLAAGVDIFFVISGFIMWVTTAGRPERTAIGFYRDRIARIVPLYWAITAFMVLVLLVAPQVVQTAVLDPRHATLSFLFVPAANPINGGYTPLLIPGWTLNYEMFFYLLFGAAIALGRRNMGLRAGLIIIPLTLLAVSGWLFDLPGVVRFYARDIILEFAFGIGLGIIYLRGRIARSHWWWAVAALGIVALAFSSFNEGENFRAFKWGLPATLIVTGCLFAKPVRLRPLEKLGDWSYSLYLSHPIVLSAAAQGWRGLGDGAPLLLFPFVALIGCVAASAFLYRFAEMPMSGWAKAVLKPRAQVATAPAAAR